MPQWASSALQGLGADRARKGFGRVLMPQWASSALQVVDAIQILHLLVVLMPQWASSALQDDEAHQAPHPPSVS